MYGFALATCRSCFVSVVFFLELLLMSASLIAAWAVLGVDACVLFVKYWLLPIATWGFAIFYIRSYSELPCVDQHDDQLLVAYTHEISPRWFDSMFVSISGFNYNLSHHLMPWVPFYYLPKIHRVIAADPVLGRTGFFIVVITACSLQPWSVVHGCANDP